MFSEIRATRTAVEEIEGHTRAADLQAEIRARLANDKDGKLKEEILNMWRVIINSGARIEDSRSPCSHRADGEAYSIMAM